MEFCKWSCCKQAARNFLTDTFAKMRKYKNAYCKININKEDFMDKKTNATTDEKLLETLKKISAKGHNAEVKQNKDGSWIIYDVKKEKTMVG